jgi:16S rRNA (guanine(966)-N(2))-methyltransferase RsmD
LFNVLAPRIEGARFLDLYAGSGAVGIEALSRGAAEAVFVERAPPALKALRANLARLEMKEGAQVTAGSVATFLRKEADARFDLVFLDPPYDAAGEYAAVLGLLGSMAAGLLADGALVIAEHFRKDSLDDEYGSLRRTRLLQQGDAALSFYGAKESKEQKMDGHL